MSPQAIGHTLTLVPLREQIVVLVLLLGCGLWASRAKTRLALVAVAICAIFWLRANSHLEGLVLVSFSSAHGLTLADLLVPLVAALVLSGQTERRRNERERRTDGRVGGRRRDDLQPVEAQQSLHPEPDALQPAEDVQPADAVHAADAVHESDGEQEPDAAGEPDDGHEPDVGREPGAVPRTRSSEHDEPAHDRRGRQARHRQE